MIAMRLVSSFVAILLGAGKEHPGQTVETGMLLALRSGKAMDLE
jgi:hypothetical protein